LYTSNFINPKKWDEEIDVIIVGSGFAGLSAAIEAREAGLSVLVLEKMKGYGGNSTISDGVMAAAGTSLQNQFGIQDTPQKMMADMMKAGLHLNHPELVRTVAENSAETFEWTVDYLGVEYIDRVDQFGGHSIARGHKTKKGAGASLVRMLLK
jgi:succinate dehydrogenase/fumarate reductase flavoprotein subunit